MFNQLSRIITLIIVVLMTSSADAKVPLFFSFSGESISKVADFPDTEDFKTADGDYIDAGCIYKQVSIMFIPVWNYDIRWCGYIKGSDSYLDFDKEELDLMAELAEVELPETPSISFWNAIGGKLVFILLIVAFILYVKFSPDDEEEEEAKE